MDSTSLVVGDFLGIWPTNDILRDAVSALYKWLFTAETAPPHVASITRVILNVSSEEPAVTSDIEKNSEASVYLPSNILEKLYKDNPGGASTGIKSWIIQEAASKIFLKKHCKDDSYPPYFRQGIARYVMLREDLLSPHRIPKTSRNIWYGYEVMPHFLNWIAENYGEDTVCKLVAAWFRAPYDKSIFEKVTGGTPISSLWRMYHSPIVTGGEQREVEKWNADISGIPELWPIPKLNFAIKCNPGDKGVDIFLDTINPINALVEALLGNFNHLYTPRTAPNKIKQLTLQLQSGMVRPYDLEITPLPRSYTAATFMISSDLISSSKLSAENIKITIVMFVSILYNLSKFRGSFSLQSESKLMWLNGMPGYVLHEMGFASFCGADENAWSTLGKLSDLSTTHILLWIERTAGKGTVKKLHELLIYKNYDPWWFVKLTGKSLKQLFTEYKAAFPQVEIPEEFAMMATNNNELVVIT